MLCHLRSNNSPCFKVFCNFKLNSPVTLNLSLNGSGWKPTIPFTALIFIDSRYKKTSTPSFVYRKSAGLVSLTKGTALIF